MGKDENQTSGAAQIQVFEQTMDNPEDQDELNRLLHKPGEPNNSRSATIGRKVQDESTTEPTEKNSRSNG